MASPRCSSLNCIEHGLAALESAIDSMCEAHARETLELPWELGGYLFCFLALHPVADSVCFGHG